MALKDKLMTLEDFKAVRDVDVASNSAQFTGIKADLDDLESEVESMDNLEDGKTELTDWIYGKYINLGSANIGTTINVTTPSSWYSLKYMIVECSEGDEFSLDVSGTGGARAWAFLTSENTLISLADANTTIKNDTVTAPADAGKAIFQTMYRYSDLDTTTDLGHAFKINPESIANSIRYTVKQSLTGAQQRRAQENIGLIQHVIEKEDFYTTPPSRNQILFTSEDVNVNDKFLYHIKFTYDDIAVIVLYDNQNNVIYPTYGKSTYGQILGDYDGEFSIPEGFSYAKWVTNQPNATVFTLSRVVKEIDEYSVNAVRYDIEQNLTETQKATARANIGVGSGGEAVQTEEPAPTDIPMLYLTGTLPSAKAQGEYPVRLTYKSRTTEFSSYATVKVQGDSTAAFPKKNYTIKLFKDSARTIKDKHKFKNWSGHNKFVIKANWVDITHARNVVGARIWSDMVKTRSDYSSLPTELLEADNLGCIDGFPVMMYANGQYYGRYAFNITKDDMLNMDDSNPAHAMVQGQGYDAGTRFEQPITTNWSDELTDDLTHVETRWKAILSFVGTSSDADFKANLGNYFSVPSLIDFYLFGSALFSYDSYGKNQSYLTYDGNYFICSAYDMDLILGVHSSGQIALGATEEWLPYMAINWTDQTGGHSSTFEDWANNLYKRLSELFSSEINARWAELRAHGGALSFENIDKRFVEWCSLVTTEQMKEDYASSTANGAFTGMSSKTGGNADTNNIRQITKFVYDRLTYLDSIFA